jgi:hypothetical protein
MSLSAPPAIYTPPSAGSPPAAPGAVHAVPSASPYASGSVHSAPAASPAAPGAVHAVPVAGGGVAAVGQVDFINTTALINGTFLTVGGRTYEFSGSESPATEGQFFKGTNRFAAALYFAQVINGTAASQITSPATTQHETVEAAYDDAVPDRVYLSARIPGTAGNSISLSTTAPSGYLIFSGETLTGGSGIPTPPAIHAAPSSSPGAPPAIFSPP